MIRALKLGPFAVLFAWLAFVLAPGEARADDLSYKLQGESSGYKDTDAVNVLTEGAHAEISGVTTGWSIGGGVLVDVVTAASTDIVSTASPKWTDVRVAPALSGHFRVGDTTLSLAADASVESDYYSGSGTAGVAVDLRDKSITPAFTYGFAYDVAGRRQTPLSVYALSSQQHTFDAAVTFVVNASTIIVPSLRVVVELGDMEKPYRYLPTFAAADAGIGPGAPRDRVDAVRTGVRLSESVPDLRHRYALSALLAHRFHHTTLRVEQRLYADSWWLVATTTDMTLPTDFGGIYRIWPHFRLHAQSGVSFWERAYVVKESAQGLVVPNLRVGDPELGPIVAGTGGVGFRVGGDRLGLTTTVDAIYTRFLDHLYTRARVGGLASVVFDVEIE